MWCWMYDVNFALNNQNLIWFNLRLQILLLDEATSALDSITEREIQVSSTVNDMAINQARPHALG